MDMDDLGAQPRPGLSDKEVWSLLLVDKFDPDNLNRKLGASYAQANTRWTKISGWVLGIGLLGTIIAGWMGTIDEDTGRIMFLGSIFAGFACFYWASKLEKRSEEYHRKAIQEVREKLAKQRRNPTL